MTMTSRQLLERCITRSRILLQRTPRSSRVLAKLLQGRRGLEIGGPSEIFRQQRLLPVYSVVEQLDNCDFSSTTTWAEHPESFVYDNSKAPGRNIFCDGSDLRSVPDRSYDFVLSSHNLEHFANPVKALREWQRVTINGGILVLVLPDYRYTFDRRRQPTPVSHMLQDFEQSTPETDLTHLPDILANHDLSLDPGAGTPEDFRKRSEKNFENRCLHHHVFSPENTRQLLEALGMSVLELETAWPYHIIATAKMPA